VAILTLFLIVAWIALGLLSMTHPARAMLLSLDFLILVVPLTFGATSTPLLPVLPGPGGMDSFRLELISLAVRMFGCLPYLLVMFFRVLSLIIVQFFFVLMFGMSFHLVQAFGNSTSLFWNRRSMSPSFLISGLPGAGASHLSRRWPNGGRKEKARSKASPSRIAPAALKGPPSPGTF